VAEGPRELQPMLGALNRLLERTAARLSRERGFTAVAAHELRTPLAALRMQAQVASREADPERQSRQLGSLLASVDRCDHLLDQLLTLARLEHDDPALATTTLDLHKLFNELRTEMQPALERWGGTLVMEAEAPTLQARAFAVQTLLRNLIANAIAYGAPGGQVQVRSSREGAVTVLTVDDNGPGIPEADRERVFERYVRLDRRGPTSTGVGLGLSIVRAVAEEHGAQVQLQDSPLGGLRVRVSFPDKAGPADSPARAP
jgi:signal transduction histidine kinase